MNNWSRTLKNIAWRHDYVGFERECEFDWNDLPKDMRHYILSFVFNDLDKKAKSRNKQCKILSKEFYQLYHKHHTDPSTLIKLIKYSIRFNDENILYMILFDQIRNIEIARLESMCIKPNRIILFEFLRYRKLNQLTINPRFITSSCLNLDIPTDEELEHIYQFLLINKLFLQRACTYKFKLILIKFFLIYKTDVDWIKSLDFDLQDILKVCNFANDKSLLNPRLNGQVKFIHRIRQMVEAKIIELTAKSIVDYLCNISYLKYPQKGPNKYNLYDFDQRNDIKQLLSLFDPFELFSAIFETTNKDKYITNKFIIRAIVANPEESLKVNLQVNSSKLDLFVEQWGKYSIPHAAHNILINKQLIYSNILMSKILEFEQKLDKSYLTYLMYKQVIPINPKIIGKSASFGLYFRSVYNDRKLKALRFYFQMLEPEALIKIDDKRTQKCCDYIFYLLIKHLQQFPAYKNFSKNLISDTFKKQISPDFFEHKLLRFEVSDPKEFSNKFFCNHRNLYHIQDMIPIMNVELLYHMVLLKFDLNKIVETYDKVGTNILARLDVLGLAIAENNEAIINFYFQNYRNNQAIIVNYINNLLN